MGWFQLYHPRRADIRRDLIHRARDAGFTTPKITPRILYRCMVRPAWSMATLAAGSQRFRGLEKYINGSDMRDMLTFIGQELGGSLDWDYLDAVR